MEWRSLHPQSCDSSKRLSLPIQLSKKWSLPGMAQTRRIGQEIQQLRKQVPSEVGSSRRTVTCRPQQPAVTAQNHMDRRKSWRKARCHQVWLLHKSMFKKRNCAILPFKTHLSGQWSWFGLKLFNIESRLVAKYHSIAFRNSRASFTCQYIGTGKLSHISQTEQDSTVYCCFHARDRPYMHCIKDKD